MEDIFLKKLAYHTALATIQEKTQRREKILKKALKPKPPKPKPKILSKKIPGLDLNQLNPLVTDPEISMIECSGENKNIIIKKQDKITQTSIKLTETQIRDMIYEISRYTKIPIMHNTIRVLVGNFLFEAIFSEITGSSFIFTKLD